MATYKEGRVSGEERMSNKQLEENEGRDGGKLLKKRE